MQHPTSPPRTFSGLLHRLPAPSKSKVGLPLPHLSPRAEREKRAEARLGPGARLAGEGWGPGVGWGGRGPQKPWDELRKNTGAGSRAGAPVSQSELPILLCPPPLPACSPLLWVFLSRPPPSIPRSHPRPPCPADFTHSFRSFYSFRGLSAPHSRL